MYTIEMLRDALIEYTRSNPNAGTDRVQVVPEKAQPLDVLDVEFGMSASGPALFIVAGCRCGLGPDASTHTMTAEQCNAQFGCHNAADHHEYGKV